MNPQIHECPACGSGQIKYRESAECAEWIQRLLNEKLEPCEMVWCGSCGSSYFDTRYDEDQLGKIYDDYRGSQYNLIRYGSEQGRSSDWDLNGLQKWNAERRKQIENFLSRHGITRRDFEVTFDIGGGTGALIPLGTRHAVLIDFAPKPLNAEITVATSVTEFLVEAERNRLFASGPPAVLVMLIGVLEHVSAPREFLKKIALELEEHPLESDTNVVIQVPAGVPEFGDRLHYSRKLVRSEHQTFFTHEGIREVLSYSLPNGRVLALEELPVPAGAYASELAAGSSLNALVTLVAGPG